MNDPLDSSLLDRRYPVVPSFSHFRFPHHGLPPSWSGLAIPRPSVQLSRLATVAERDVFCRVTNYTSGTERAHLVPRAEDAWFQTNAMYQYVGQADFATDDPRNCILLRSDVHTLFDQRKLAVVPKRNTWVVHVVVGDGIPTEELAVLYHNVELQPLQGVSLQCMFARFAWTILGLSPMFLWANVSRKLVVLIGDETSVQEVSGQDCRNNFAPTVPGTKSRSQSPKKRQRDESLGDVDDGKSPDPDSPRRGRSRRRRCDWSNASATSSFTFWDPASPNVVPEEVTPLRDDVPDRASPSHTTEQSVIKSNSELTRVPDVAGDVDSTNAAAQRRVGCEPTPNSPFVFPRG